MTVGRDVARGPGPLPDAGHPTTPRPVLVLLAASVLLAPSLSVAFTTTVPGRVLIGLMIATTLLLAASAVTRIHAVVRLGGATPLLLLLALALASTVSVAFHPGTVGVARTVALWLGLMVAVVAASLTPREVAGFLVTPLLVGAAVQGVLMTLQWVTRRPFVPSRLVTIPELQEIDGILRPQGTATHVYEPAMLAIVAIGLALAFVDRRRSPAGWAVLAGAAALAIGTSHSRAALTGLVLVIVLGLAVSGTSRRRLLLVVSVCFAAAALLAASGWTARLAQSTAGGLDDVTMGRVTSTRQAARVIASSPWVGVGPGRYLAVVGGEIPETDDPIVVPHDFVILAAAELGIPAAALLAILLGGLVIASWRRGPVTFAVVAGLLPFLLFDKLLYDRLFGVFVWSLWLGALAVALRNEPAGRSVDVAA